MTADEERFQLIKAQVSRYHETEGANGEVLSAFDWLIGTIERQNRIIKRAAVGLKEIEFAKGTDPAAVNSRNYTVACEALLKMELIAGEVR